MINPIDGSLQVYSASPRNSKMDLTDSPTVQGKNLWGDLFKHISTLPADADESKCKLPIRQSFPLLMN